LYVSAGQVFYRGIQAGGFNTELTYQVSSVFAHAWKIKEYTPGVFGLGMIMQKNILLHRKLTDGPVAHAFFRDIGQS